MKRGRPSNRGFTLLEMLLAVTLSSLVVLATMSMLMMIYRSEKRLGSVATDNEDLAITQEIIRRAMQSLIAAPPLSDEQMDELFPDANGESLEEESIPADVATGLIENEEEAGNAPDPLLAEVDTRPRFDLHFVPSEAGMIPRLEIVTFTSPAPSSTINAEEDPLGALVVLLQDTSAVRGAFELVQMSDGTWSLQWVPLEPWGYPTLLIKDVQYIEWEALQRRSQGGEWQSVFSSYLDVQYPEAVRLILWTSNGSQIDWLFKVEVIPGEAL